jgi:hypothetical protein
MITVSTTAIITKNIFFTLEPISNYEQVASNLQLPGRIGFFSNITTSCTSLTGYQSTYSLSNNPVENIQIPLTKIYSGVNLEYSTVE